MTDAEKKLWWHLRRNVENTHFRRQATVGPYFVDFACHHRRLVIEVDGGGHGEPKRMLADTERSTFLRSRGYRVLRFWNSEVFNEIESVMSAVYAAMNDEGNSRAPHP